MSLGNLYDNGVTIYRLLSERDEKVQVIDCIKCTMPVWLARDKLSDWNQIGEQTLCERLCINIVSENELSKDALSIAHKRYSLIAPVVAVVADKTKRNEMINYVVRNSDLSKQTIRSYLCRYLIFQTVTILAPVAAVRNSKLTKEQKLMRWALNKYYYTQRQNSLRTAYLYLLREKYLDENGFLINTHPTYYQFRYFFRKTRNEQNFLISRKGLTDYQRNHRPLLGEGVSEFANHIGVAMLDSTICDIYLVDENGKLLGRPILTACIDTYSQMCCGFALTWQGGVSSLRELMQNVISDKVSLCKQNGVLIEKSSWDCSQIPGVMMTDRGTEYCSDNFEQISELGVTIINLPSYRPELKGIVEKFFDIVQNYYKPYLKGMGVIEPDYQQRGARNYRLDACLTIDDFRKVLVRCIVHYNSKRKISSVSYSSDMIANQVKPYPNELWNYGTKLPGANLISVDSEKLRMTLLPRTTGTFSRKGLTVNGLRYKREGFTERFLKGGSCIVSYDPDNVNSVWLLENGEYIGFELIESRFNGKSLEEVTSIQHQVKELTAANEDEQLQSEIDLQQHISAIGNTAKSINKRVALGEDNNV